jgi:orotate phosphoribosyltransferase
VQAVGGLTMGADPLAHAASLVSWQRGRPINAFSVRKFHKNYGAGGLIVGPVQPGERVVVLEDVVTTGGSALIAVSAARDFGLRWSRSSSWWTGRKGAVTPGFPLFPLPQISYPSPS